MYGIKGIAGILERLAVIALPSAVQPDGDERQKCKPLLTDLKFHAEYMDGIQQTAQQLHIDPVEGEKLSCQTPPLPSAEEVEDKDRQHAGAVVVHHAQGAQHCADQHNKQGGEQIQPCFLLFAHGFHQMNAQKTEQQRPDHVLVHRVKPGSAVHQVERHFGEHGKQRKPQGVFPEAVGVKISFHRHECEDGKGQPSGTRQPVLRGQEGRPEMIHQHQHHGENVKCRGAEGKTAGGGRGQVVG